MSEQRLLFDGGKLQGPVIVVKVFQLDGQVQIEICAPAGAAVRPSRSRVLTSAKPPPDQNPPLKFVNAWRDGHAGVPFCATTARDLYEAYRAWCRLSGVAHICTQAMFGRVVGAELRRGGAPPSRRVRFQAWSAKAVAAGDWRVEPTRQQGIVHLVCPHHTGAESSPDLMRFQKALHALSRKAAGVRVG
ncbi:MAG TPA: hypothetical protein VF169_21575 [Albitalea sp.]|uniref:hypothetical protein n=1 Tax=Piscinibacter sp. TaxID=1903157 RepID=UPI002ED4585A